MTDQEILEIFQKRRSVRSYSGDPVPMEKLNMILEAGMMSASGRGIRPWELIVVRDRETLVQMSGMRKGGAARMLVGADAAIVVIAKDDRSDTWVEDCSIVMANMHLMASAVGVGSCWIQGRGRESMEGGSAEKFLRGILKFTPEYRLEAVLSIGIPDKEPQATDMDALPFGKIHVNRF